MAKSAMEWKTPKFTLPPLPRSDRIPFIEVLLIGVMFGVWLGYTRQSFGKSEKDLDKVYKDRRRSFFST